MKSHYMRWRELNRCGEYSLRLPLGCPRPRLVILCDFSQLRVLWRRWVRIAGSEMLGEGCCAVRRMRIAGFPLGGHCGYTHAALGARHMQHLGSVLRASHPMHVACLPHVWNVCGARAFGSRGRGNGSLKSSRHMGHSSPSPWSAVSCGRGLHSLGSGPHVWDAH